MRKLRIFVALVVVSGLMWLGGRLYASPSAFTSDCEVVKNIENLVK